MTDKDRPASDSHRRLPLNAFRAFEACVRLGSMSAAAEELCVTHGAISRHVRALEDQFGLPLLHRLGRSVAPTPEGATLASGLTEALLLMQKAAARLAPGPLTLSCSATIMMKWLIPRLSEFKRANPNVEIRLNLSHGEVNFVQDQISLAIRTSFNRAPRDVMIEPLLREQIGPVGHPDYVSREGISSVASLSRARILETATRPKAWPEWSSLVNCSNVDVRAQERYEHFYLVIQAAVSQLGVAIVPRYLIEEEIESGQLVAPLGFVESGHTLNLWIAPHERFRDDVRRLAAWIKERME